ncbi:hypothetical protein [Mesorhizobium sp. YR577]|uniref:hypothetical protein n=1 Tax=Mesorhizobium sp. YR577 TaxID=1884373 RepID=UPI001587917D|nr:hypothetical protein [Mesorhizobium sp. YR577]
MAATAPLSPKSTVSVWAAFTTATTMSASSTAAAGVEKGMPPLASRLARAYSLTSQPATL